MTLLERRVTPYGPEVTVGRTWPVALYTTHTEWERGFGIRFGGWRRKASRGYHIRIFRHWTG